MRWTRSKIASAAIVLSIICFFAINMTSDVWFSSARIDLTENGLYTVSEGTREVLQSIPEPVTIRFYFSEAISVKYAGIRSYGARVRDLLARYQSISGGKLQVEVIDPEPLTEQEDLAVSQGITGAPTPAGEKIYFGLVGTNMVSGREVIPFFLDDREAYLEYDLTNLIYKLTRDKKPKIGVVSNIPFDTGAGGMSAAMQGESRSYMIYEQLRESFDIQFLEQDFDVVPADIDVVMIAHPKLLSPTTQYALDQFIMRGGRAMVFLDPLSEISQAPADPSGQALEGSTQSSAGSVDALMHSWGVSVPNGTIIGVRNRSLRVQFAGDVADYVAWLALTKEEMNHSDIVTSDLTDLNLGTVGSIQPVKGATTKFEPLVQTTDDTMEIPVSKVLGSPNPDELLRDFVKAGQKYTIAARISGLVKSAFPGGPPPRSVTDKPEAAPRPAHIAQAKAANIVLVADSDIFNDSFWVQPQELQGQRVAVPIADNSVFVLNTIENLTGSAPLISLRSRGTSNRPFTVVDDMRRRANQQFLRQEQMLQQKLTSAQNKLAELEGKRRAQTRPGQAQQQEVLTPEQEAEIEKFRNEMVETRKALRDVQYKLRRDIDRFGTWLAAINILFVPLIIAGTALVLWLMGRRGKSSASSGGGK
ncbi:MAG: Gldg family protein [Micropepsaceae bacterium]